jgi:transcriptional regulator with GAF, ATPase, and Fis domain
MVTKCECHARNGRHAKWSQAVANKGVSDQFRRRRIFVSRPTTQFFLGCDEPSSSQATQVAKSDLGGKAEVTTKAAGLYDISFTQRRRILKIVALGTVLYSIIVVVWANLAPYLGVHVFGTRVVALDGPPIIGESPKPGDRVLQIGTGPEINSWPRFIHVINHLNDTFNESKPVADVGELLAMTHPDAATPTGGRYVRIRFERSEGGSPFESWFKVRSLPWQHTLVSILWAGLQSALFGLGWMVTRRRPADDAAALFFLCCILTVGAYIGGHHWLQLTTQPALVFVFALCAMALPQVNLHFYLMFPTPKRWVVNHPKWMLLLLYGLPGVLQILLLVAIGKVFSTFRHDQTSLEHLAMALGHLRLAVWTYVILAGLLFTGCVVALLHGYVAAESPVQKNQMRWILAGALTAGLFVAYSLFMAWREPERVALGGATWAMFGASLASAAAHAVAISRYRLTDAETIVQRSRTYLLVSFVGSLLYYGLLLLLAFVSPQLAGITSRPEGLLASTSIILVLLIANTVRSNIQKIVDRRFFREKHQLERAAQRIGEAFERLADRASVWKRCLHVAVDTLNAGGGAAYRKTEVGSFELTASEGERSYPKTLPANHPIVVEATRRKTLLQASLAPTLTGDVVAAQLRKLGVELAQPICCRGAVLGVILLEARHEGAFGADDLTSLAGIAEVSSVAVDAVESNSALEKLNEQLQERVARFSEQRQRLDSLRAELVPSDPEPPIEEDGALADLRGRSPAVRELVASVRKIAASQSTVLIRGESGTGKTLLAELIHRSSPRSNGPFVTVHCASLSPGVLESELFGHVKGAFTGAHRDKVGRFQLADKGTLFLDEIGDVSRDVQTKLLRVLQEMTFEPVGASQSRKVDVRVIAATNQSLEDLIRTGRFREDLYYRLNVIGLHTPPLRQRVEDVLDLARHFVRKFAEQMGKSVEGIAPAAADSLLSYGWPGNIRELENVVERAVVLAEGSELRIEDLPMEIVHAAARERVDGRWREPTTKNGNASRVRRVEIVSEPAMQTDHAPGLAEELDDIERRRLMDALKAAGGNKAKAARLLGYRRTTYCSKLKKFGIQ